MAIHLSFEKFWCRRDWIGILSLLYLNVGLFCVILS